MENTSAKAIDITHLKDIKDVVIDTTQPCSERVKSFVEQIGNPYCYLDNGVVVEIGYANTPVTLHERFVSYVSQLDKDSGSLW